MKEPRPKPPPDPRKTVKPKYRGTPSPPRELWGRLKRLLGLGRKKG